MAPRNAALPPAETRRARRVARTIDLQQDEMVEDAERGGEGEGEGVVEVESAVEEDGGATEPGILPSPVDYPPLQSGRFPLGNRNSIPQGYWSY
jgi:hypothetical protein